MTTQPINSTGPLLSQQTINWAMLAFLLAFLVQFALGVAAAARAQAEIKDLQVTTEPLRRGDLVRIQTDVAWIRDRLEHEERR